MKKYCALFFLVLLSIVYSFFLLPKEAIFANDEAQVRAFNFTDIKKSRKFYTNLDGEWYFFPEVFIDPLDVEKYMQHNQGEVTTIPSSFKKDTGKVNTFGTYVTKISLSEQIIGETLAIHVPYQYSAYRLYANNNEIARNGEVGTRSEEHRSEMAPRTGYFIAQGSEITLTMHVSSFDHINGGFSNSIFFGDARSVSREFNMNMIAHLFTNGIIFVIGLFMVLFAAYRRRETVFFLFGTFCILISARSIFTVPFYYTFLFSDMSWLWGTRFEYLLSEASSLIFMLLWWKWHENIFSKKVMYITTAIILVVMAVTFVTEPVFFQKVFFNVFYLTIPFFFYVLYVVYKGIRHNNVIAKVNVIGLFIIFLAFFNDFALGQKWINSTPMMLPAVGVFVIIHVIMMSRQFAKSVQRIEEQNIELISLNESNEKLADKLRQGIIQKDDFLANTSHELRNPLHGIMNLSYSILNNHKQKLDQDVVDDLRLQMTIGQHMTQTIENLLDFTRLKEQRIVLNRDKVDVRATVTGIVDMMKVYVDNKRIELIIDIPEDFPPIYVDKNRFIQILFNLLHNAVKFTHAGTITIAVTKDEEHASFRVTDTGIGIEEKVLNHIFMPYEQIHVTNSPTSEGLGLGLSICKELVELHGGKISVDSKVGIGSTFTFTIPFTYSTFNEENVDIVAASLPEDTPVDDFPAVQNITLNDMKDEESRLHFVPKILAVDDDPVNLHVLTSILSEDEYDITTVASAEEALEQIESEKWDLVIADVMMPEMSGYELTRSIREKYSISELPILLLTARSSSEDIYTAFLAGANDYVTKPVDGIELNARVQTLTKLQASINERLWMEAAWLQAQIRPHFLLNTLNSIAALSEIDSQRMVLLLQHLAQYLQHSFYLKNLSKVVPIKDELSLVESYVYVEKERFQDRLRISYDIDESLLDSVTIPPLSLQTLVENAVNHGVLKKARGGTVQIVLKRVEEGMLVKVIDDGVGMSEEMVAGLLRPKQDQTHGIGLYNTEQRLKNLYGKGLTIESTPQGGTTVSFIVPLKGKNEDD